MLKVMQLCNHWVECCFTLPQTRWVEGTQPKRYMPAFPGRIPISYGRVSGTCQPSRVLHLSDLKSTVHSQKKDLNLFGGTAVGGDGSDRSRQKNRPGDE